MPTCRQVPIVALADPGDLNSAFRAGASFAVPRPVAPDLLENTLCAIYRLAVGFRRQYARHPVELPLTLVLNGRSIEAKATDIGTGGMALGSPELLDSGAIVTVRFALPGSEEQITALGEIRWTDRQGRAGLRFNSVADNGRGVLQNWIVGRHTSAEHSLPSPSPQQRVSVPEASDDVFSPARDTDNTALIVFLIACSLLVVGFWIYIALTN